MGSKPREWLIRKGGYFYRPNKSGYTTSKFEAGRYTEADARREAEIEPWHMKAIHESEWPDDPASAARSAKEAELATLQERVDELTREKKNLRAALTARAKTLLRLRKALVQVHDHIEDEGDRVYFGSTNDAEMLKDVWHELDGWVWDGIIADGKLPDVYESSRKAHTRAETAEARVSELEDALGEAKVALEPFADANEFIIEDLPDDYEPDWSPFIAYGDYRRARTTLTRLTTLSDRKTEGKAV